MDKYRQFYRALDLHPGDSWAHVRKAYKRLIRSCHPDHFDQNEPARLLAEERSKEINQAYQEISAYYQQYGRLPLDPHPISTPPPPIVPAGHHDAARGSGPRPHHAGAGQTAANHIPSHPSASRSAAWITVLAGGLTVYLLWMSYTADPTEQQVAGSGADAAASREQSGTQDQDIDTRQNFSVGSTVGEVFAVQGAPTRIDGDIWFYGEARIYFKGGHVTHWTDTSPPRLSTGSALPTIPEQVGMDRFDRGSSKTEVRAIQGNPMRESETAWDYGLSRVFFDQSGKVSGWNESPMDPLRVKR